MKVTNEIVIDRAKKLGFDLIGFAKAEKLEEESEKLSLWLKKGYHHKMDYMERNFEKRKDVGNILPDAKSVVSLGLNYYTPDDYPEKENAGKVSRYAWGKDYHLIIWEKLYLLSEELKEIDSGFESASYVDTGPVMDKAWAVKSGIGWLGKHTNVISKEIGSWFFIANIITNREFSYNKPIQDFCGDCTACIDACPTDAIVDEYVVDANRCISNLTIENRGEIPEEFKGKFENWIFGCDICQDVCPWNGKFPQVTNKKDFHPNNEILNLDEVKKMTNSQFKRRFAESPVKRARLKGLKRNAEFLRD